MTHISEVIIRIKQPFQKPGWIMTQTWEHLLFIHWAVSPEALRGLIPNELEIDTYDGKAWIGILPFLLSGVRIRRMPTVPYTSAFPEINVRTYVKTKQKSGIYFLSLDASNPLITSIAKRWYRLPYFLADMQFATTMNRIEFESRRLRGNGQSVVFSGSYEPIGLPIHVKKGTLEHWLTERYTLFCQCGRSNQIFYADVYHEPWVLQQTKAQIRENTMTQRLSIPLGEQPDLSFYARGVQSYVWPITILG
ncbi:YqjF family protein [Brevibacillus sp. NRS-1366]|uniref:YqjF family protein n=1 Tax=Brevibacillus sp. NRS-1366 TaxID=3233899 RepID=UPI003D1A47DA